MVLGDSMSRNKKDIPFLEEDNMAQDFLEKPQRKNKGNGQKRKDIDLGSYVPENFDTDDFLKPKSNIKEDEYKTTKMELPTRKEFTKRENILKELPKAEKENFEDKENKKPMKRKKGFAIFISFLFTLMLLCSILFVGYAILFGSEQIKQTELIINSLLLFLLSIFMIVSYGAKKEGRKKRFAFFSTVTMTGFILFNLLTNFNIIQLPTNTIMKDFTGKTITEALKWADAHHIKVSQKYDNSEVFEEYSVIKQDVYPNTLLKSVDEITFIVSNGPDYDKEVSISDMTGWNIDDAVKVIDDNFLNNVKVEYEENNDTAKDIILSQSKKGSMKRSDEMVLKVSLGKKEDLEKVEMINLKNMTEFKATLWLKRNGIPYEMNRDFNTKVKKGNIMKQDAKKGETLDPKTALVHLTASKGKKIVVPNLASMSTKDITKWVVENRLKIAFSDKYDRKIEKGKVISANYKEKEEIEEGTLIEIVTSKGQLTLPKFDDLGAFRDWAATYNILYIEEYQQNKDVEKGKIIHFSANPGDVLNPDDQLTVYISSGSTIVVPNFVGRKKTDIEKLCKETGLQCTFYYAGTSSKDKDIALSQNKKAGSEVLKDTYVNIGLSTGKNTSNGNNNVNTNPNKPDGGGSKPSPTPTPTPNCKTTSFYIQPDYISIDNPEKTCSNVKAAYSGYSINCNYIASDSGRKGQILNTGSLNGTTINSCKTVTINIKNN